MAVSKIMETNALKPSCLGAAGHLMVEQMLRHGREYPRIGLGLHMQLQILLDLVCEKGWHRHHAVGLRGFRRVYDIHATHAPEGLRDMDLGGVEVDVGRCQREHLANAQPAPEQYLEGDVGIRFVCHGIREAKVLLPRPDAHLALLLGADLPCDLHRVPLKAIEAHQMVHDR